MKNMKTTLKKILILLLTGNLFFSGCKKEEPKLFVGRFNKPGEKGMSVYELNKRKGELTLISEADAGPSPAFMCFSEQRGLVYAANEVMEFGGVFGGGITTLRYDSEKGSFDKVGEIHIPYGGPCHISLSHDGDYLLVANYPNGSVAVVRLDKNGIPEEITDIFLYLKESPNDSHAHMILHDPDGKRVYVTDLGMDRIVIYNLDPVNGKLIEVENGIITLPRRSGPRHFTFNADGSLLYLINEFGSTVMVYRVDEDKGLIHLQTIPTVREGFITDNYCADIHISKDGRFLYGSNRGENTIVIYRIEKDGTLSLAGHASCGGDWPRNFTFDPSGKFLIVGNQKSNYISVFKIDRKTGFPAGASKNYDIGMPVFHKFVLLK